MADIGDMERRAVEQRDAPDEATPGGGLAGDPVLGVKSTKEVWLMRFTVETEREDGRWIAEVSEILGVLKYGKSREQAIAQAEALALRVIADRIEH